MASHCQSVGVGEEVVFVLERWPALCYTATAAAMAIDPEVLLAQTSDAARALQPINQFRLNPTPFEPTAICRDALPQRKACNSNHAFFFLSGWAQKMSQIATFKDLICIVIGVAVSAGS